MCLILTPIDCTLAAQSATRWVVSLAAWIPLSVNCTKLMYVGMMLFVQVFPESVLVRTSKTKPMKTDCQRQMPGNMTLNSIDSGPKESLDPMAYFRIDNLITCQ